MQMKMILRLGKNEEVRFVSHLDTQSMLQRTLRRADIPVSYSKGYHPHAQISFALALGVGLTSEGEYVDIKLEEDGDANEFMTAINECLPSGFFAKSAKVIEKCKAISTYMHSSDFLIMDSVEEQRILEGLLALMEMDTIDVIKSSKSGPKTVNIRPMIHNVDFVEDRIVVRLWTSAAGGLSPALLMQSVYEKIGLEFNKNFSAGRLDIFNHQGESLMDCII